ncbi:hypothetical protein ACFYP4_02320 [Streptomyces sp. NPDC005551]|uniref:hypothetical protein n=1 Tax=Streptomyces sp. NPDC005551 TaxID=3364725 RepID=UPI00367D8043
MDESTLTAARAAEQALKDHHNTCLEMCQNVGAFHKDRLYGPQRCEAGKGLYTRWNSFRPVPLPGSRTTQGPDGGDLSGHVVDKTESIGPYTILRLLNDASRQDGVRAWMTHMRVEYVAYVDGKSTGQFWYDTDLDTVLLFAMDWRRNESGSHAYYYAARVLGIEQPPEQ